MSDLKLLPCPFCGGIPAVVEDGYKAIAVHCFNCGADITAESEKKACAAWNRRAQPENKPLTLKQPEVVRCKDCKHNGTWQCHMEYDEYYPEADIHHEMHGDDDFCSYGVKEDGDSNDE